MGNRLQVAGLGPQDVRGGGAYRNSHSMLLSLQMRSVRAERPEVGEGPQPLRAKLEPELEPPGLLQLDKVTCGNQEAVDMCVCVHGCAHMCVHGCVFLLCTHICPCTSGDGRGRIQGFSTHLPFLHQRLHLGEVHVLQLPRHVLAVTRLHRDRGQGVSNSG